MGRFKKFNPMIVTSVRVSPEFHKLAMENGISFTEALRSGISILLAERGVQDYDNELNIYRRLTKISELLDEKIKEVEELRAKIEAKGK